MRTTRRTFMIGAAAIPPTLALYPAYAKGTYDEGATDSEITA